MMRAIEAGWCRSKRLPAHRHEYSDGRLRKSNPLRDVRGGVAAAERPLGCFGVLLALAPMLLAGAAEAEECLAPAKRDDGWTVSAPAAQGLDPALICAIGPRFEAWSEADLHAVVVARHGSLVYEHYLAGADERWGRPLGRVAYGADKLHDLRSITKSVTSLMVGIALDHGWIEDIEAPIFSFFPEYAKLRTRQKDTITLRHLLTMSAGFAWEETLIPYSDPANSDRQMTAAADPYRYLLGAAARCFAG